MRASLLCVLPEHGEGVEHAAVAVQVPADQAGGSVWARWWDPGAVSFAVLADCTASPSPDTAGAHRCVLFGAHPGACSRSPDAVLCPDPERLPQIRRGLDVLCAKAPQRDRPLSATGSWVAQLLWDELRALGLWASLSAGDRTAVHWMVVRSGSAEADSPSGTGALADLAHFAVMCGLDIGVARRGVASERAAALLASFDALALPWQSAVLASQQEPDRDPYGRVRQIPFEPLPLEAVLAEAAERSARGEVPDVHWPYRAPREGFDDRADARAGVDRLRKLPRAWQSEALRLVTAGASTGTVLSSAVLSINYLRSHGVYLAWCAEPTAGER